MLHVIENNMHPDQDEAAQQLEEILSMPPPALALPLPVGDTPLRLGYPTRFFYDKHIDKCLELRGIKPATTFLDQLNDLAGQYLGELRTNAQHTSMPGNSLTLRTRNTGPFKPKNTGVPGVAQYLCHCVDFSLRISSRVFLFPRAPDWNPYLLWVRLGREGEADSRLAVDEIHALALPSTTEGKLDLDENELLYLSPIMHSNLEKL
uniref:Uncharacterized protein n=1 Tax=Mycena chlorophos TaxID=658473 RepID=A0ABQ0L5L6_MYCCL|nr:predicted protein [Mycena chlorophos]